MSRLTLRELHRRQRRARQCQSLRDRRGVLLMVVLAMLALFLLIGTAFLLTSSHYADTEKAASKVGRVSNQPSDELERGLMQLVRDTNNPYSTIRWHSLLRDMYGSDGFIGRVYADDATPGLVAQYAGATLPGSPGPLGATGGQLIDIYVADQPVTLPVAEAANVIKIERDANGLPVDHQLPGANGYYAGCVLTMLEGPAAGRSTRVVDYRFVGAEVNPSNPVPLYRLRVVAFPRTNGQPLTVRGGGSRPLELAELVEVNPNDASQYRGYAFMVNGRPHNGTGVGLNSLAATGSAKLSAVEPITFDGNNFIGMPIAMLPNSRFVDSSLAAAFGGADAQLLQPNPVASYVSLNSPTGSHTLYPNFEGLGGSDESYDAVDYQNMFLASIPLTPRSRGGFIVNQNGVEVAMSADQMMGGRSGANFTVMTRIDTENVPIPSFHRPALVNYWYHRLVNNSYLSGEANIASAVLAPYGPDGVRGNGDDPGGLTPAMRDQLVALKRKFMLRPLREDHPGFDGSNPLSHYSGVVPPVNVTIGTPQTTPGQIQFPFWEAIGPWDVDNDGDGVPDSIWVDIGEPVQETEDGRLYKRMYAYLVIDLDNRLDLNAHGSPEHMAQIANPINDLDPTQNKNNLMGGVTSNMMPQGLGYGPADVSLRPVLSPQLPQSAPANVGNALYDDYQRLLAGNLPVDGFGRSRSEAWGKFGSQQVFTTVAPAPGLTFAGTPLSRDAHTYFDFVGYPETDVLRTLRLNPPPAPGNAAYPAWYAGYVSQLRPFGVGSAPDLKSRYAGVGIGYDGQPVNEAVWDLVARTSNPPLNFPQVTGGFPRVPLVDDSPYELDLSYKSRKGVPQAPPYLPDGTPIASATDDAPFATAELERLLRAYDADVGTLPARLWNLVDAFDPVKFAEVSDGNPLNVTSGEELALAQTLTAINRRSVTTDSSNAPVPSEQVPSYITELGPDGAPGNAGNDDDGQNGTDDPGEIGFHRPLDGSTLVLSAWSDDFASLTGKRVGQARLVDVAWYRIQRSRIERGLPPFNFNNPNAIAQLNSICEQILPPEVLRGEKFDLNRPFGDGLDNNGNGVVDEPIEAGEPFLDLNGNGVRDNNEPFINLDGSRDRNGNATYSGPLNQYLTDRFDAGGNRIATTGDLTIGKDISGSGAFLAYPQAMRDRLRDDQHLARQLYARHLYVLMLLLTDENYVAPYDPQDPQVQIYVRQLAEVREQELVDAGVAAADARAQAKFFAQRRMSLREIAQWAANCVDFRDADGSCTPFEYDENPWDGWNVTQTASLANPNPANHIVLPIDSDPSTDESRGQYIDWTQIGQNNNPNGLRVYGNFPDGTFASVSEQTRQIVWGAERPELLITETLAWHDRRTENAQDEVHGLLRNENEDLTQPDNNGVYPDDDLDQGLRPQGAAFVEIYNPWSGDGSRPPELYSKVVVPDRNNPLQYQVVPSEGVELSRLSTSPAADGKRSPVWRVVVVEEHPQYRNTDPNGVDKFPVSIDVPTSSRVEPEQEEAAERYDNDVYDRLSFTNPDWGNMYDRTVDSAQGGVVQIKMRELKPRQIIRENINATNGRNEPATYSRRMFSKPFPYIEREFYFASGGYAAAQRRYTQIPDRAELLATRNREPVRVPFGYITIYGTVAWGQGNRPQEYALTHRFLAADVETASGEALVSPVVPGRYAVIGPRGPRYRFLENDPGTPNPSFSVVIGRPFEPGNSQDFQSANFFKQNTRRFQLFPRPSAAAQQLMTLGNGAYIPDAGRTGGERSSDVIWDDGGNKVYVTDRDGDLVPDAQVVMPVAAFPIDDFNISEPIYGYGVREDELEELEQQRFDFEIDLAGGEGRYVRAGGGGGDPRAYYDTPFDVEPELRIVGTTPNYRVFHLQRLADPNMPWNPEADYGTWDQANRLAGDTPIVEHDPSLPVNPYLTVDSSSCDLTAFNGVSNEEASADVPTPVRRVDFTSLERGRKLALAVDPQFRQLFGQEPPRREKDLQVSPAVRLDNALGVQQNQFNFAMRHSIGLANEAFGDIYLQAAAGVAAAAAPTGPAIGMPRPGLVDNMGTPDMRGDDTQSNSTYNSLAWNNRPFVSAGELLQVPAASQGTLLRKFTTPNPAGDLNAYAEPGLYDTDGNPVALPAIGQPLPANVDPLVTNAVRYEAKQSYFGHLLNFFQANTTNSATLPTQDGMEIVSLGSANYYRMFDYVHVPSRFSHTDTMLSPSQFGGAMASVDDPRRGLMTPFNRVDNYSEPGRINLNTVIGRRNPSSVASPAQTWSLVYDGIMHRLFDGPEIPAAPLMKLSHLGPAWRDIVRSRRGYLTQQERNGNVIDVVEQLLDNDFPTFVANPFRAPGEADLVPLSSMRRDGIEGTLLRPHHFVPNAGQAWGAANVDSNGNGWISDTSEAGLGDDAIYALVVNGKVGGGTLREAAEATTPQHPLFSAGAVGTPGPNNQVSHNVDALRNPAQQLQPLTRIENLTTTRSGVFAVWVTVGYFEVTRAPSFDQNEGGVRDKFLNQAGGDPVRALALYNTVYPDGYQFGRELGSDTGEVERHRGFYMIDRTRPVAFKPGEDVNVNEAILLRRRIE
jgi:hypothetical protein